LVHCSSLWSETALVLPQNLFRVLFQRSSMMLDNILHATFSSVIPRQVSHFILSPVLNKGTINPTFQSSGIFSSLHILHINTRSLSFNSRLAFLISSAVMSSSPGALFVLCCVYYCSNTLGAPCCVY